MPRPMADEPRSEQLLLRLTSRQLDVLESVAHLERTKPNTYAYTILVEHLDAMTKNPRVQADLANRSGYDADGTGATSLRERMESDAGGSPVTAKRSTRKRKTS